MTKAATSRLQRILAARPCLFSADLWGRVCSLISSGAAWHVGYGDISGTPVWMDVYRLHLAEYAEHFRPGSMRLFSYAAGGLFQRVQQPPGHFHAAGSCIHRILREKRPQQEAFLLVSEQKNSGGQAVDFTFMVLLGSFVVSFLVDGNAVVFLVWNLMYSIFEEVGYKRGERYPAFLLAGVAIAAILSFAASPGAMCAFWPSERWKIPAAGPIR